MEHDMDCFSRFLLTLPMLIPEEEKKANLNFIFTLLSGALKGYMKALQAPQRSAKIKI